MKKILSFLFIVMLFLAGCGSDSTNSDSADSSEEPIVYKISAGVPESHFEVKALKKLKDHVESETNGEIDVQIFPDNQLGDDKEALELIQQGSVQMVPSGTSVLADFEKSFSILSSPYLFKSMDDIDNILNSEWGDDLLETLDGSGFTGLGYGKIGLTNISNSVRPIVEVEDLEGLKIRTVENPLLLDFYKEVGASPVAMSMSELFSALQQGVVDGQFNPFTTIDSQKFQEAQDYISKTSDIASLVVFTVNEDDFNELTSEQQQAIREGVDIATASMDEDSAKEEEEAEESLREEGLVEINEVSDETKEELFKKGLPIIEKYGKESNSELFDKLIKQLDI